MEEQKDGVKEKDDQVPTDELKEPDLSPISNPVQETPTPKGKDSEDRQLKEIKKKGTKRKANRCSMDGCDNKVRLLGFPCRCGGNFCAKHRYGNEHNCSFDYREHGQSEIRKNNPPVVGEKIQKL